MVTCQCGSAARSAPETPAIRAVSPLWSAAPSPSKSKFTPSSDLAPEQRDEGARQGGGCGGRRRQRIQGALAEVVDREHYPLTRRMRPRNEVDQVLALEARPAGPALVETAVGVHADREVGDGRQPGEDEGRRLGQRPVGREGEVLAGGERGLVGLGGRGWRGRARGRGQHGGARRAQLLEHGVAGVGGRAAPARRAARGPSACAPSCDGA